VVGWHGGELLRSHPVVSAHTADEAEDLVSRVFQPHRLTPLDSSAPVDMRLNAAQVGEVTVGYLRYGADVRLQSEATTHYLVGIPVTGIIEVREGLGAPGLVTPRQAAVVMPGRPVDAIWRSGCAQFCVMFEERTLAHELELILGRPVRSPVEFTSSMDLTATPVQSWLRILELLERESGLPGGIMQNPLAAARVQSLVIDGLLLVQNNNYSEALHAPTRPAMPGAVRRAVALMEERPQEAWTTPRLAQVASVGVRSLQDGFRQAFGVAPMAYLRDVRLARAHAELTASSPDEVTVGAVAARWGFPHASRFAGAYRRKFGCSPLQTLRGVGAVRSS
jgi:AraC-like DNA-binding protein